MRFEFYVLNHDFNSDKIYSFNIFNNSSVQEWTEKAVRKYVRSPKNFVYKSYITEDKPVYGFEGFCKELDSIIRWQEMGRVEYEISVGPYPFHTEEDVKDRKYNRVPDKLEKWDCYMQAKPNIEVIAREVIYQYKKQKKEASAKDKIDET